MELSVAIIFKNEIRCLERCLRSLQPLRERLSCEIVMADTGSTDGSRAVAEKYADIVFDFPWVNDFAAARNAVLERCSGRWALTLDCDEWLEDDGSAERLAEFLRGHAAAKAHCAELRLRDYPTEDRSRYSEAFLTRLLRRLPGLAYRGAIHESPCWDGVTDVKSTRLRGVLLHHDGYVVLNDGSSEGKAKLARNRAILREELAKSPEDLWRRMQVIDLNGDGHGDFIAFLRETVKLVEHKAKGWERFGPPILRSATAYAYNAHLPELEDWARMARELFPDSYFTRLDVNYIMLLACGGTERYADAAAYGEAYLSARESGESDPRHDADLSSGTFHRDAPYWEQYARITLAEAYRALGREGEIPSLFTGILWELLEEEAVDRLLRLTAGLYEDGRLEPAPLLARFWDGICAQKPSKEKSAERRRAFLLRGSEFFGRDDAWRMFLPLRGACPLGDAAALMACESAEEADAVLSDAGDLAAIPAEAFVAALKLGAEFPLPNAPLTAELGDVLAKKLKKDAAFLEETVIFAAEAMETEQDLLWADALARAAAGGGRDDEADAMRLICAVVRIESVFLPYCYAGGALKNPAFLPPEHRFILHLVNACAVLMPQAVAQEYIPSVTGGVRGALSELKEAVKAVPEEKWLIVRILDEVSK